MPGAGAGDTVMQRNEFIDAAGQHDAIAARRGELAGKVPRYRQNDVFFVDATGADRAGVDPASDRALIAWLSAGVRPRIEYASGTANGRYRPRATPAVRAAHAGTHWLRITLAAVGGLALAAVAVLVALRARGRSRTRAGR